SVVLFGLVLDVVAVLIANGEDRRLGAGASIGERIARDDPAVLIELGELGNTSLLDVQGCPSVVVDSDLEGRVPRGEVEIVDIGGLRGCGCRGDGPCEQDSCSDERECE